LKALDQKLAAMRTDPGGDAFILADAKDADMAFGVAAPVIVGRSESDARRHGRGDAAVVRQDRLSGASSGGELAGYDSDPVVRGMGGASGTTFDAFRQPWEARKHGARAAPYGRMIDGAEDPGYFIGHLRALADGALAPEEAVRPYHADLSRAGIAPHRSLEQDLQPTSTVRS